MPVKVIYPVDYRSYIFCLHDAAVHFDKKGGEGRHEFSTLNLVEIIGFRGNTEYFSIHGNKKHFCASVLKCQNA
jgi:hypothetical protein